MMMDGEGDDTLELTGDDILDESQEQPQDGEDLVIEIEGEDAGEPADDTPLIKQLRNEVRETKRELAGLKRNAAPAPIEVGKKPDLWEDCEGDPDKYDDALIAYHERKRQADAQQTSQQGQQQAQAQQFEQARVKFFTSAATMGVKDPEAAVQKVADALSAEHAGFIMQYTKNPAALMAALNANPAVLNRVAEEADPIRQFAMLAEMGARVTIKRKGPPAPESHTIQRGSASLANVSDDKKEADLLKKGQASGDMTDYSKYMREKRRNARQ